MLTRLLNAVLWVEDAFARTDDPVLSEYRTYQRHFVLSVSAVVAAMLALFVLAGLMDGAGPLAGQVVATVAMVFLGLALLALLWGTWATYQLWRWGSE